MTDLVKLAPGIVETCIQDDFDYFFKLNGISLITDLGIAFKNTLFGVFGLEQISSI